MFGMWRVFLALSVGAYHLAGVPLIGEYAVFAFFVLAGFLMTSILDRTYGYTLQGRLAYLQNRALRLFPNYWFAVFVGACVAITLGDEFANSYSYGFILPRSPAEWLTNFGMLYAHIIPARIGPRLVPPSWALFVEWVYYTAIGLGIARTSRRALVWAGVSIAFFVTMWLIDPRSGYLYASVPAGSLPFSLGALTFYHQEKLRAALAHFGGAALPLAFIAQAATFTLPFASKHLFHIYLDPVGNVLNAFVCCAVVALLNAPERRSNRRAMRWDKRAGDFSYSIYLLHFQAGALVSFALFAEPVKGRSLPGLIAFGAALLLVVVLALVPVLVIDPLIAARRDRIRRGSSAARTLEGF